MKFIKFTCFALACVILLSSNSCRTSRCNQSMFYRTYRNDTIVLKGILCDGVEQGEWRTYFENGQERSVCSFDKGILRDGCTYVLPDQTRQVVLWNIINNDSIKLSYPSSWKVENNRGGFNIYFYDTANASKQETTFGIIIDDTLKIDNYKESIHALVNDMYNVLSYSFNDFRIGSDDYYFSQYELSGDSEYDNEYPVFIFFCKSHNNGCIAMSMRTSSINYDYNFIIFIDMIEHCYFDDEIFYSRFKSVEIPASSH